MTTLRDKVLALVDAHHGALDTGSYGPTLAIAVARMVMDECAKECDELRIDDLIVSEWEAGRQAAIADCADAIRKEAEGLK